MNTFRRINDPERYYGMSWRGWLGAGAAGGLLYLAVRISPLGFRPTITIAVLILTLAGMALYGLSGQAIGPGRYLLCLLSYRMADKQLTVPEAPDKYGLVLDAAPESPTAESEADVDGDVLEVLP